jgi:hypothetical protein
MARRWADGLGFGWSSVWFVLGLWLAFYVLVYLIHSSALVQFPFDFDQGEGYDVNSAWLLSQGQSIYASPDSYPFYSSNYPPLFSLLLAPIVGFFGPQLAAGRLLSIAATAGTALLIAFVVRRETGLRLPAMVAALLFLASPYVYHVTPLARVNALMLFLALAGVYAVGYAAERGRVAGHRALILGGILLLAALFTKQLSLDAAGAALLFLALRDWRRSVALGAAILAAGGGLYLALDLWTGGGFSLNIFWANANPFKLEQAVAYFRNFWETHPLIVLGGVGYSVARFLKWGPLGIPVYSFYFFAALVVAVGTGKWGAGESYFLGAIAAGCILVGYSLGWVEETLTAARASLANDGNVAWRAAAAGAVLLVGTLLIFGVHLRQSWHGPWTWPEWGAFDRGVQASVLGRSPSAEDIAAGERIAVYLRSTPGDVLAEESAFALVVGRPVLGNATQQRNLHEAGRHDPAALVRALESGEIGVVVLNAQQYPPPVLAAIGQNCYLVDVVEMNRFRYLVLLSGRR